MARTLGGVAELKAMQDLITKGFKVSRPVIDTYEYDLLSDWNGTLKRIQVKCTDTLSDGRRYKFEAVNGIARTPYEAGTIDYLMCYVIGLDLWYVIPHSIVTSKKITVYPQNLTSKAKYEIYKNRWELLKQ